MLDPKPPKKEVKTELKNYIILIITQLFSVPCNAPFTCMGLHNFRRCPVRLAGALFSRVLYIIHYLCRLIAATFESSYF